jgi:hypothetical protein
MEHQIKSPEWQSFLDNFTEVIWPEFEKRGFTRMEAMMSWQMNCLINEVSDLTMAFEVFAGMHADDDDPDPEDEEEEE